MARHNTMEVTELRAERDRLREALAWYVEIYNFGLDHDDGCDCQHCTYERLLDDESRLMVNAAWSDLAGLAQEGEKG